MTALVTADLHLSSNPRDDYRHVFAAQTLVKLVKQHAPKQLIILGDLTEQKDNHGAELVNAVVGYLARLAQSCDVYVMRGNHDCLNPNQPFFEFVHKIPKITWITHPADLGLDGLGRCLFLPHTRNYKKDWARIDLKPYQDNANNGFIFCHNTFEGAITAAKGHPLKGIPTTTLPPKAHVISGDVHYPQQLDQVTYVGAPYTVTFGDAYSPRMLLINGYKNKVTVNSIPVTGVRKRTIEVDDPANLPPAQARAGDLLKIRVHLKVEDYVKWGEIQTNIRKWGESTGAIVCQIKPIKTSRRMRLKRSGASTSRTDLQLLHSFGERRALASPFMKTGEWLMKKV